MRNKHRKPIFSLAGLMLSLVMVCMLGVNALAKENQKPTTTPDQKEFRINAVTVTAQKQEENVQEVPLSISVLNDVAIEDANINSVNDISARIPNLFIYQQGPGTNPPTMRGISAPSESMQVSTGLFVDGAPIISPAGYVTGMLDIERIEVLRGPQGTLYGNGAEAGIINIVTRQPNNELHGKIATKNGSWLSSKADHLVSTTSLLLNGPIAENKLFFSVAGQFDHKAGFIKNEVSGSPENDIQSWYGKGLLRWEPTEKLDIALSASRIDNRADGGSLVLSEKGHAAFGTAYPGDRKVNSVLSGQHYDTTEDLQTLKIDYSLSKALTLTSVTANWKSHPNFYVDYDNTPAIIMHNRGDFEFTRLSEELRLGYAQGKLKWLTGLYVDMDESDTTKSTQSMIPGWTTASSREIKGQNYSIFGNLTYPLTDALCVVAGIRYETTKKKFNNRDAGTSLKDSWSSFSPKASIQYSFSPNVMTYATVAQGYRSGGYNAVVNNPAYYVYDPETLWSYEVGTKTTFLNDTLMFNAAIFYMTISDMQVPETLLSGFSYLTNAGEATSKGIELEMNWKPTQELTFMSSFGYTNIEFDNFKDAAGDYKGNKNPWAPDYTFNLGVQYRHQSGWFARADVTGIGKIYFDKANQNSVSPYQLVNAKVGYEWEHFNLYVYGKNIFDKRYDYINVFGGFVDIKSDPGEVGIQLDYRF